MRTAKFALCLAALALPIWAHHAFSSEFDANKPITLTGKVITFTLTEPHSTLTLDTSFGDRWTVEGASGVTLGSRGWTTDAIKEGSTVSVEAYAATDGSKVASGRTIVLPDSRRVSFADATEDGGPVPVNVTSITSDISTGSTGSLTASTQRVLIIGVVGVSALALILAFRAMRHA